MQFLYSLSLMQKSGKQSDLVYEARKNAKKHSTMLFSTLLSIKLMKNIGKLV